MNIEKTLGDCFAEMERQIKGMDFNYTNWAGTYAKMAMAKLFRLMKITTQKDLTLEILEYLSDVVDVCIGTTSKIETVKDLLRKDAYKGTFDPIILMTIGFPACGKSTFLKSIDKLPKDHIFSSDDIRAKLFGDPAIQGNPKVVFDKVYSDMKNKIKEIKSSGREDIPYMIALDATNLSIKNRKNFIENIFPNSPIVALDCANNIWDSVVQRHETMRRNAAREKTVPKEAMERMIKQYSANIPSMTEGFADIIRMNPAFLGYDV